MKTGDLFESLDDVASGEFEHRCPPDADLLFYPRFFDTADSRKYFETLTASDVIEWRHDEIEMYGRTVPIPRLNAWYGDTDKDYSYSGIHMNPLPWIPVLTELKNRIEPVAGVEFSSVLVNLYRDGEDSVSWHSDDEPELGRNPVIASASFGAPREFQLRHKAYRRNKLPRESLLLENGSLLIMRGTTQHYWQHQLPKRSVAKVAGPRINLTFRKLTVSS